MMISVYSLTNCDLFIFLLNYCSIIFRHTGPVWQVAWAHPLFGSILASCSYDRKVIVWKEIEGKWSNSYEYNDFDSSGKLLFKAESFNFVL